MYKLTALVLVSILSQSLAAHLEEECRSIKTTHQFDPVKYFGKKWYVTYELYADVKLITPSDVACMKNEYNLLTNGIVRELDTTYIPKNETYFRSECYINLADFTDGSAVYVSVARPIDKDGRPLVKEFYPLQNNIVDTDYDTYSFVYTCLKLSNGKTLSMYNVLNRELTGTLNGKILSILEELDLKADDFTRINNDKCKEEKI